MARTAVAALQDCPGLLDALPGEAQPSTSRPELLDILQRALAYVSNAVSLHRDISTALYAVRHYRCPCGTCHFAGNAHAAWAAYRRHLLRAVRALPPR